MTESSGTAPAGNILVIEDQPPLRANIVEMLELDGFEVLEAANGVAGLEQALQCRPDLIICDVMMPEMDGFELLRALRARQGGAAIPFIFLSARADRRDIRGGMELGADDYLTKPFSHEELVKAVRSRLRKHAEVQSQYDRSVQELCSSMADSVPHEMLTPLNGILGFSQFLIDEAGTLEAEMVADFGRTIHSEAERLHRLIRRYLSYAELELSYRTADGPHGHTDTPARLLQEAAEGLAAAAGRTADLVADVADARIAVSTEALRQLTEELVDNALKFSAPGTPVALRGSLRAPGEYVVSVSDRGRGMSAEEIAAVGAYMQFQRRRYEQRGCGLGLAIAQLQARLHGGSLRIESEPGRGTNVEVTLPLARAA